MILSDVDLRGDLNSGHLKIEPLFADAIQPASIDLHLGARFRVFDVHHEAFIDPQKEQPNLTRMVDTRTEFYGSPEHPGMFMLHPGTFVLGETIERVEFPPDLVGRIEGRSSLGRLGLLVHSTAGFIDPGFRGTVTLEMSCVAPMPIMLRPGMGIAQIAVERTTRPAVFPYGHSSLRSKYQDQDGPQASRYAS